MKFGDRGIDVIKAQEFLIREGFLDSKESYYSIKTIQAVKDMEKFLGISETGEYTKELKKLYDFKTISDGRKFVNYVTKPTKTTKKTVETNNTTSQATFQESVVKQIQKIPCYLVNLITNTKSGIGVVYFPHIPDEFSYTKGNNFEETETKGRSEPFQGYNNSSALTVDVSLTISADYATEDIDTILNKLEAFAYPRYSDAGRIIPPKCFFRCASFSVEGILENVNITRRLPIINGKYSLADINLSIIETNASSISASTVQKRKTRT